VIGLPLSFKIVSNLRGVAPGVDNIRSAMISKINNLRSLNPKVSDLGASKKFDTFFSANLGFDDAL
jgi:hypothetical protein